MKEIQRKNYYILAVLLIFTILLTLWLSNLYLNKEKMVSDFYQYSNKITSNEFDEFMIENSDIIIYISDKYNLKYEEFEKKLKSKIEELNIKSNLIYIDKNEIDNDFLTKFKKTYNVNINLQEVPILIVIIDKQIIKNMIISQNTNVDTLMEYGVFE